MSIASLQKRREEELTDWIIVELEFVSGSSALRIDFFAN